jgi:hypothetical protein
MHLVTLLHCAKYAPTSVSSKPATIDVPCHLEYHIARHTYLAQYPRCHLSQKHRVEHITEASFKMFFSYGQNSYISGPSFFENEHNLLAKKEIKFNWNSKNM